MGKLVRDPQDTLNIFEPKIVSQVDSQHIKV